MEDGWASRSQGSALKRTTEVWGFLAQCGLKVVKAGKTKGTDEEISAAKTVAAEFIRDGESAAAAAAVAAALSATLSAVAAAAVSAVRPFV